MEEVEEEDVKVEGLNRRNVNDKKVETGVVCRCGVEEQKVTIMALLVYAKSFASQF